MARPRDIAVIDTLIEICDDPARRYDFLRPLLRDQTDSDSGEVPLTYLFGDNIPRLEGTEDFLEAVVAEMDTYGIEKAMIVVDDDRLLAQKALTNYPGRFVAEYLADANRMMDEVRKIERMHREWNIKAVSAFPVGLYPPVPVGDKKWYPIYAKCVELNLPFVSMMGVPGPRVPYAPQDPAQLDEICYLFPDLTFVTRHGCEPWEDLMVKLMLKWPNLYYSTTAFRPKYYPKAIIDFANTRGADKIIYGGYFPIALSLQRIFEDMDDLPLRDHVWPKFLRENAARVFKI